jgi:hypothetical protein
LVELGLAVNFAAIPNVGYSDCLTGIVNSVEDAVITEVNPPASTIRQFLASGRTGILTEAFYLGLRYQKLQSGQRGQLFLRARQDEKGVAHFRERFISAMACSKGMGVSPEAMASS